MRTPLRMLLPPDDRVPDAVLLTRYATEQDEAAFELLVRRHADLVWSACVRVLHPDTHAAEDAFQATFLTLARKADSIRTPFAGGWLHAVAVNIARRHRAARKLLPLTVDVPETERPANDHGAIHEALAELPESYRLPIVLCDLQELTHAEAAKQLGWPVGTVSGRLVRGRERLKACLERRGVTVGAVALSALVSRASVSTVQAGYAAAVGQLVAPVALSLSQGVISAMRIAKLKLTAAILGGTLAIGGLATVAVVSAAPRPDEPKKAETPPTSPLVAPPAAPIDRRPIANARDRARSINNLKQILLAVHNYESATTQLPTDIVDAKGKPLLSWRVHLLPYLEQDNVYRQFKLNEPWDSPANLKAAAFSLEVFGTYMIQGEPTPLTHFLRPSGPGTSFEMIDGREGDAVMGAGEEGGGGLPGAGGPPLAGAPGGLGGPPGLPGGGPPAGGPGGPGGGRGRAPAKRAPGIRDIHDGMSNTVFVFEAERGVPWSKPDDVRFDPKKPVDIHGPWANVIHLGMGDGAVRTLAGNLPGPLARKLFSRSDGEVIFDKEFVGTGWVNKNPTAEERAALLKELDKLEAEWTTLVEENRKAEMELFQRGLEKIRKGKENDNLLAAEVMELEKKIAMEKAKKQMRLEADKVPMVKP